MELQYCRYEKRGHVAYVTITRPEVLNALHMAASVEMEDVWDDFEADDELWLGVLTGEGNRAFSAGNDLKAAAERGRIPQENRPTVRQVKTGFGGLTNRFHMTKPLIARVNGVAMGGGMEMALACDIVVAADHARFGLPEVTLGLTAGGGGLHRLPRLLPEKIALGYLLTGRHFTAQRAFELGLVNELTTLENLDAAVQSWVDDILKNAPLAVRATKEAALQGLGRPLADAMAGTYEWEARRRYSEDATEGPRAFAEKRPPVWKNR